MLVFLLYLSNLFLYCLEEGSPVLILLGNYYPFLSFRIKVLSCRMAVFNRKCLIHVRWFFTTAGHRPHPFLKSDHIPHVRFRVISEREHVRSLKLSFSLSPKMQLPLQGPLPHMRRCGDAVMRNRSFQSCTIIGMVGRILFINHLGDKTQGSRFFNA